MTIYRGGLVGCGRIGTLWETDPPTPLTHAGAMALHPQIDLEAGSSRGAEHLQWFGKRWGVDALYRDYRAMFERERLDIVSIATHPGLHLPIIEAAVAAGVKGLPGADHTALPVAGIVTGGLVLAGLLSGPVRREFGKTVPPHPPAPPAVVENEELGWRVGHRGRDQMFYEEHHDGAWQRIEIDGEMLTGPAHHVIYFADEETWRFYPEWARHRRDEIIARVKSRFREPDYEYAGGGRAKVAQPDPVVTTVPHGPAGLPKNDGTILPALVFLLAIGSASLWFAWRGVETGETRLPMKHNPLRRTITRADDPALFWTSIGLAGGFGGGCVVLSAWMVGARFRRGF